MSPHHLQKKGVYLLYLQRVRLIRCVRMYRRICVCVAIHPSLSWVALRSSWCVVDREERRATLLSAVIIIVVSSSFVCFFTGGGVVMMYCMILLLLVHHHRVFFQHVRSTGPGHLIFTQFLHKRDIHMFASRYYS